MSQTEKWVFADRGLWKPILWQCVQWAIDNGLNVFKVTRWPEGEAEAYTSTIGFKMQIPKWELKK